MNRSRKSAARLLSIMGVALVAALMLSSIASAATSAWHVAGNEFKGEETYSSYGFLKLEIPGQSLTFECTESGSGTISGGSSVSGSVKYSCKAPALPSCTFKTVESTLSGTATSESFKSNVLTIRSNGGTCKWYETTEISTGSIAVVNPAAESIKPEATLSGTGTFLSYKVTISGFTVRELSGANVNKAWGYNSHNTYQSSFGSSGTGDGQFGTPTGSALDAAGNIWVLDPANSRAEQFSSTGTYLSKIGPKVGEAHRMENPMDIAIDGAGTIWVTNPELSKLDGYNVKGEWVGKIGKTGTTEGTLNFVQAFDIDSSGNFWITNTGSKFTLQKFNSKGEFLKLICRNDTGVLFSPKGIDVGPNGNVWVTDTKYDRVVEFNEAGEFVRQFGSEGTAAGQFKDPAAVQVDASGHVWVVDTGNARVQEFTETGEFMSSLGSAGSGLGQFSFAVPSGLSIDALGNMWVSDSLNHRVQRWSL